MKLITNIGTYKDKEQMNLAKGPFKYYVSMFLDILGPPTHIRQHK
jgi:hypothetical protein